MKSLEEIKNKLRELEPILKQEFKIGEIGLFGSYVRGEQNEKSDLDVLVKFDVTPDLLKLCEIKEYLSEKLGVKVDLVMKTSLKPRIGKRILAETVFV